MLLKTFSVKKIVVYSQYTLQKSFFHKGLIYKEELREQAR